MNTSARRDGTPDRGRGNPARRDTGSRDAGGRGAGGRESGNRGTDRRDSGARGAGSRDGGGRGADRWESGNRGTDRRDAGSRGTDRRDSGSRGAGNRDFGNRDFGNRGTDRRDSDRRGTGSRDSDRWGTGSRDSDRRGTGSRDSDRRGTGSRDFGNRDASRGGAPRTGAPRTGAARPGAPRTGAAQSAGTKKPHRGQGATTGATNKWGKPKQAKPQRQVQANPTISNAKPARHQHADNVGPAKLPAGEGVRLQKVLAQAGVASRRAAEELIDQGRVEVDGLIVLEQGLRVDPENAVVRVDGIRVVVKKDLVHIALNKPRGWQSTMSDDLGRPCIGDIVSERVSAGQRLFHVGRLDADTEGLILLTNDGDLAHRLMHPSFEVPKTYLATVNGVVDRSLGKTLKAGVELEDGPAKADAFTLLDISGRQSLVKIVLHEGRKHIVRRLLEATGHPVVRLVRTDIGPVALGDGRPGTLRVLGRGEVGGLYKAVGL